VDVAELRIRDRVARVASTLPATRSGRLCKRAAVDERASAGNADEPSRRKGEGGRLR